MDLKTKIIALLVAIGIGYGVGRYLQPSEVITKTEKIEVEVDKERVEYRTIVRYIKRPDGTEIKEEVKEEIKEKEHSSTKKEKKLKIVKNFKPQWKAQVAATLDAFNPTDYRVGVEKRVIGPFFAGGWVKTDFREYGISISMEF